MRTLNFEQTLRESRGRLAWSWGFRLEVCQSSTYSNCSSFHHNSTSRNRIRCSEKKVSFWTATSSQVRAGVATCGFVANNACISSSSSNNNSIKQVACSSLERQHWQAAASFKLLLFWHQTTNKLCQASSFSFLYKNNISSFFLPFSHLKPKLLCCVVVFYLHLDQNIESQSRSTFLNSNLRQNKSKNQCTLSSIHSSLNSDNNNRLALLLSSSS